MYQDVAFWELEGSAGGGIVGVGDADKASLPHPTISNHVGRLVEKKR